jgi:hypothetical protein
MIRRGIGKQGYSQALLALRLALINSPLLVEKVGEDPQCDRPLVFFSLGSFLWIIWSSFLLVRF